MGKLMRSRNVGFGKAARGYKSWCNSFFSFFPFISFSTRPGSSQLLFLSAAVTVVDSHSTFPKMRSFSLLALAAPLVAAIEFTSPAANTTLSKGDSYTLSWNTVDTDPSEFSIYLVNFVNWPPYYAPLAYNVETASGSVAVDVPCGVDSSYGYQLYVIPSPRRPYLSIPSANMA